MSPILLLVFVAAFKGCQAAPDPCLSYQELNEPHRSSSYVMHSHAAGLCDSNLSSGWYRFTDDRKMATSCVPRYHCGTLMPMWMNGTHPAVSEGTVARKACVNFGSDTSTHGCCDHYMDIGVKNCGNFYVYYLRPTHTCPLAYCTDDPSPIVG